MYESPLGYRAFVHREPMLDMYRLLVWRPMTGGRVETLMTDGTWQQSEATKVIEGDVGVPLPMDAVEAVRRAFAEMRGPLSEASTEVKVLREWLEHERSRGDLLFDNMMRKFTAE